MIFFSALSEFMLLAIMYYWEIFSVYLFVCCCQEKHKANGDRKEEETLETFSFIYDYYFLCVAIIILDVQSFAEQTITARLKRAQKHVIIINFDGT